jgi:small-conductance mechanosensitive channel
VRRFCLRPRQGSCHIRRGTEVRPLVKQLGLSRLATPTARAAIIIGLCLLVPSGFAKASQQVTSTDKLAELLGDPAVSSAAPPERAVTLRYNNRPIVEFRAQILSRMPAERASTAERLLDRLVATGRTTPITTRMVGGVAVVSVHATDAFVIVPADVDVLSGESVSETATQAASRLEIAFAEGAELRKVVPMLKNTGLALVGTVLFVGVVFALLRARGTADSFITRAVNRHLDRLHSRGAVRAARLLSSLHHLVTLGTIVAAFVVGQMWLAFTLTRFPYTRPWGESLRTVLSSRIQWLALGIASAIPGLFTVALIAIVTWFAVTMSTLLFEAVERGEVSVPGIYPDTAQPTRHLVAICLWLLALAVSYPYLPGSGSDAFKGVSVFVGLMVSLGSSGLVNQVMSGLTLTYSRALRRGDVVRIGDVEGVVIQVGTLSTKVKTRRCEEITIPNAVVVADTVTNYSRFGNSEGVIAEMDVTIGYDAPWRQVHSLLQLAAERTPGIRQKPRPQVIQRALEDFGVKYTLQACLDEPHLRAVTLSRLHANIQDAFNSYGVQIMSPHYEADPEARKIVPRENWYLEPTAAPRQEPPTVGHQSTAAGR